MRKDIQRVFGWVLFGMGVIMLLGSQSGFTGNVISERAGAIGSILSLVYIIVGLSVLVAGLEESTLRERMVKKLREKGYDEGEIKKKLSKFDSDYAKASNKKVIIPPNINNAIKRFRDYTRGNRNLSKVSDGK